MNCKTANSIWVKLAAQYLQNASASTHVLQARFFHYQFLKGHSMTSHITVIEGLAQQLEYLGSPTSQSQIMTKIVSTLPTAFRNFMTVWDNLPELKRQWLSTSRNWWTNNTETFVNLHQAIHQQLGKTSFGIRKLRNQEDLPMVEKNELSFQTCPMRVAR